MRGLLITALLVALVAVPVAAQTVGSPLYKIEITNAVRDTTVEVNGQKRLELTLQFKLLRSSDNQPATDVTKDDIVVKEDGQIVKELQIQQPRAANLMPILAMDVSGSMKQGNKMEQGRSAASFFMTRLDPRANVGLILFDDKIPFADPNRFIPLAKDPKDYLAHRALVRQKILEAVPLGGTAFLDATVAAINLFPEKRDPKDRLAVLLMTDGVDTDSKAKKDEVIQLAKDRRVQVYTLGVGEAARQKKVNTVLVLDHSGSMNAKARAGDTKTKMEALHEAGTGFVDRISASAQVTLLPFSSQVEVPLPFTSDKEALKSRIRLLRPEGGTLIYDATYAAIDTLAASGLEGKRAIVALTDGRDEAPGSRTSPDAIIERAREANVAIYMIGLGQPHEINEKEMRRIALEPGTGGAYYHASDEKQLTQIFEQVSTDLHDGIDEDTLREIADKTGAKYYPVRDASKLQLIYDEIATELESTYTVTFTSPRQSNDGTARGISISVMREGKLLSAEAKAEYTRPGLIPVPVVTALTYLLLLGLLGVLIGLPAGLRNMLKPRTS